MKKYLLFPICLLINVASFAQEAVSKAKSFKADPVNHSSFPAFIVSSLGIVVFILLIATLINVARILPILKERIPKAASRENVMTAKSIRGKKFFGKVKRQAI